MELQELSVSLIQDQFPLCWVSERELLHHPVSIAKMPRALRSETCVRLMQSLVLLHKSYQHHINVGLMLGHRRGHKQTHMRPLAVRHNNCMENREKTASSKLPKGPPTSSDLIIEPQTSLKLFKASRTPPKLLNTHQSSSNLTKAPQTSIRLLKPIQSSSNLLTAPQNPFNLIKAPQTSSKLFKAPQSPQKLLIAPQIPSKLLKPP